MKHKDLSIGSFFMLSEATCKRIDKFLYSDSVFYKYKDLDVRSCFIIAIQYRRGYISFIKMGRETQLFEYKNMNAKDFLDNAFFCLFEREDLNWKIQNWDRL